MKKTFQHKPTNIHIIFSRFFPVLYDAWRNNHGRHFSTTWREDPGWGGPLYDCRLSAFAGTKQCDMRGCQGRFLGFSLRCKKALRLSPGRFYSQNLLSGVQVSDTGFNPTRRALDRADREFELLGLKATFQGSALKLEDAPKLKLPEVMSYSIHMLWFNLTHGTLWYFPLFCIYYLVHIHQNKEQIPNCTKGKNIEPQHI